jgi:hypothetical protein
MALVLELGRIADAPLRRVVDCLRDMEGRHVVSWRVDWNEFGDRPFHSPQRRAHKKSFRSCRHSEALLENGCIHEGLTQ